jgi:hypothetical protein
LYEPHAVQRIMRVRALFSSARIRTTPQFPHIYSLVGLAASSTGGALATPETESGSGTSLSLLCGRAGIVSFPITRAASALPKKEPRALAKRAGRLSTGRKKHPRENMLRSQMTRGVPAPSLDFQYNLLIALISVLHALPEETEGIDI